MDYEPVSHNLSIGPLRYNFYQPSSGNSCHVPSSPELRNIIHGFIFRDNYHFCRHIEKRSKLRNWCELCSIINFPSLCFQTKKILVAFEMGKTSWMAREYKENSFYSLFILKEKFLVKFTLINKTGFWRSASFHLSHLIVNGRCKECPSVPIPMKVYPMYWRSELHKWVFLWMISDHRRKILGRELMMYQLCQVVDVPCPTCLPQLTWGPKQ